MDKPKHVEYGYWYTLFSYTKFETSSIIRIRFIMLEFVIINTFREKVGVEFHLRTLFPLIIETKFGISIL